MLHITFSKYDCIIVHKAYYLFTCTCVSINSFHSHSHGRGVLCAGGDPCMTVCLECPLTRPVLAQSWSQTATDGAWYSTTSLLSGRDRPRCLCVLRLSGSESKTRRTGV